MNGTATTGMAVRAIVAAALMAATIAADDKPIASLTERIAAWVESDARDRPDGWTEYRGAHYLLISDAKPKYPKRLLKHAEAVRQYLDREFTFLGQGQVPPAQVRLFAKEGDLSAYTARNGTLNVNRIVLAVKYGGKGEWERAELGKRIFDHWLFYRAPHLRAVAPYWLKEGLRRHVGWGVAAGATLKTKMDPYNRKMIREHIRLERTQPMREWLSGPDLKMMSDSSSRLAGSLVNWFLTKARSPHKDLLQRYVSALTKSLAQAEKELGLKPDAALNAESATQLQSITGRLAPKAPGVRKQAAQLVFGDWDDKAWSKLQGAWLRHAK